MIGREIIIKKVDFLNDGENINTFLTELKEGGKTFRYFKNRPLEIIINHILTILAYVDDKIVGYGHLDEDSKDNKVWLGVAVADNWTGKGIGRVIMKYLLKFASENSIPVIFLSVDNNNEIAIKLYTSMGFEPIEKRSSITVFGFIPPQKEYPSTNRL